MSAIDQPDPEDVLAGMFSDGEVETGSIDDLVHDLPPVMEPVMEQVPSPAPAVTVIPNPMRAAAAVAQPKSALGMKRAKSLDEFKATYEEPKPEGRSGPAMEASLEVFRKHAVAIVPDDEVFIVAEYLSAAVRSMHTEMRREWRETFDDAITPLHDVREEIAALSVQQRSDAAGLKSAAKESSIDAKAAIEAMITTAVADMEKRLNAYSDKMAAAAEAHFGTALRELVLSEVRIGLGRGMSTEVDLLRSAARDATSALAKATARSNAATQGKAKPAGAGILAEITALSNPAQATIGILAAISFLAILKVFI